MYTQDIHGSKNYVLVIKLNEGADRTFTIQKLKILFDQNTVGKP